jgi:hypothetical protein
MLEPIMLSLLVAMHTCMTSQRGGGRLLSVFPVHSYSLLTYKIIAAGFAFCRVGFSSTLGASSIAYPTHQRRQGGQQLLPLICVRSDSL